MIRSGITRRLRHALAWLASMTAFMSVESASYLVPSSDSGTAWNTDQRLMARGTMTGGESARSWLTLAFADGTTQAVSVAQGGSRANPTSYGVSASAHAYAEYGSASVTALQAAQAHAAAWVALGRSASASTYVDSDGLTYGRVTVTGAVAGTLQTGGARSFAATGSGRVGTQRVYFGTDAEQSTVSHSGVWIWQRIGTALGAGRITSIGCHGTNGYVPRLAVAIGGTFASPGAFTSIRYGDIASGISSHNAGRVAIEALQLSGGESIWVGAWSNGTGELSRRAHGATPSGQFAWTLNEAYRTVTAASSVVEDGSETFSFTGTGNFYTSLFVTFEDAANGYQADGVFASGWYGAVRAASGDTPTSLVPGGANDSFRHTALPMARVESRAMRIAFNTVSALNGVLCWCYSFNDWNWPESSATRRRLGRRGGVVPSTGSAYNSFVWRGSGATDAASDTPIYIGTSALAGDIGFKFGNCQGVVSGGGSPTGTAIWFDPPNRGGETENLYLGAWPDTFAIDVWNDAILDPDNLAGPNRNSRSQYYQDEAGNMPRNVADATLPDTYDVSSGTPSATPPATGPRDRSFGSILRAAISIYPQQLGYREVA